MATTIEFKRLLEAVDRLEDEEFEELLDRVALRLHREERTLAAAIDALELRAASSASTKEELVALIRAKFKRDS